VEKLNMKTTDDKIIYEQKRWISGGGIGCVFESALVKPQKLL